MTDVREVTTSAFSHLLGCEPVRIDGGAAEVRLGEALVARAQGTFMLV